MSIPKVVVFLNYPAHYTDGVISSLLADHRVDLDVVYYNESPTDHKEWNRSAVRDPNIFYCRRKINIWRGEYYNPEAIRYFKRKKYDLAIISGRMPFTSYRLLQICHRKHIPYIFASDTALLPIDGELIMTERKKKSYRRIADEAAGLWVPGRAAQAFWRKLCGDKIGKKLIEGRYLLDQDEIVIHYDKETANRIVKEELGFQEDDFIILFVGALHSNRQIERLTDAHEQLLKDNIRCKLLIIGDGHDSPIVIRHRERHPESVRHIPKVPYNRLNDYYLIADCYAHPGAEPYSLALVQAIINKVPVVTTDHVGAAYDYIIDGVNGFITPLQDDTRFLDALFQVINGFLDKSESEKASNAICQKRNARIVAEHLLSHILTRKDDKKR